jgi:hypothetical protein
MLLGHYYLTAPAMSLTPLKRAVALLGASLAARGVLAGLGLCLVPARARGPFADLLATAPALLLAARWGVGFVGAASATYFAWRTLEIRSTQSATGILYIAIIFLLFGELTSLVLAGGGGVIC